VTVKDVQPREDCVIVETDAGTFTAQVVVGADGLNGVTRRWFQILLWVAWLFVINWGKRLPEKK
jgi:flavin-dependent dehydrogenase